jgi:FMN phosphatase YigB (HAD superfamily)
VSRPTKYSDDQLKKAKHYMEHYQSYGDAVPTIEGLADELEVSRQTLYNWSDKYEDFFDILERLMAKQCRKLINGALTNEFNSPFAKMMATKHGYSDKIEQDLTSSDGSMKPTEIVFVGLDGEDE